MGFLFEEGHCYILGWLLYYIFGQMGIRFSKGKTLVHEQNADTWEFGKGALSELRFCGVAVLQSEK